MSANHSLQKLLDELGRLPGIGPKSAQRIAYYLLEADAEEARRLAEAILEVKQEVHFCSRCFNYATADPSVMPKSSAISGTSRQKQRSFWNLRLPF